MKIIAVVADLEKHFKPKIREKGLIHMSDAVKRKCNSLIKSLCANYDNSNCLLLDNGDYVPCPQIRSNSLICKYFRDAVLGADKVLHAQVMGADGVKTCTVCGRPFRVVSNRAKYCERCREKIRKENNKKLQREKYRNKKGYILTI